MRYHWLLFLVVAGCASTWERHQAQLAQHETKEQYALAVVDERWLIDNAFYAAPVSERAPGAEAERYLDLARLAVKAGHVRLAVEALRQALAADAHQAAAVRAAVARLPLPAAELERTKQEFAWNIAALAPGDEPTTDTGTNQCWSYRVRELRIRHRRTVRTPDGLQREVTYDARPWAFHASSQQWQPEGPWFDDVGMEVELVGGPEQPRYRAITFAEHEFFSDEPIPPCHHSAWQGPFASDGTIFVTARLPVTESEPTR